jgi:hypothetical protein
MARITRPSYRRKSALRLSKGEAALEAAFKEKDVYTLTTLTGTTTLTYIPDVILTTAGMTGNCIVDIVIPEGGPDAYDRVVRVVNQDAAQTVQIKVNGGTGATALAATKTADYYIADSTATTTPVALFVQA